MTFLRQLLLLALSLKAVVTDAASSYLPRLIQKAIPQGRIPYSVNVLHSGVVNFAPWLELHHVVLLSLQSDKEATGCFAIDFSPYDQTKPDTLLKLLRGQSVPAEIRVRWIPNSSRFGKDLNELKKTWACMGAAGDLELQRLNDVMREVVDVDDEDYQILLKVIKRVQRKWSCAMNLYSHNCQHFSAFVSELVKSDAVCPVT